MTDDRHRFDVANRKGRLRVLAACVRVDERGQFGYSGIDDRPPDRSTMPLFGGEITADGSQCFKRQRVLVHAGASRAESRSQFGGGLRAFCRERVQHVQPHAVTQAAKRRGHVVRERWLGQCGHDFNLDDLTSATFVDTFKWFGLGVPSHQMVRLNRTQGEWER